MSFLQKLFGQKTTEDKIPLLLKELKDLPPEEKNQMRLLAIIRELGKLRDDRAIAPLTEFDNRVVELMGVATKAINGISIPQDAMNRALARIQKNELGPQELVVLTYTSALSIRKRLGILQDEVRSTLDKIRGNGN